MVKKQTLIVALGGRGRTGNQRQQPGVSLDLDRLCRTGGDPGVRTSCQTLTDAPNPRVRVLERPPYPSPNPPTYRSMEPSNPTDSLWSRWEPPCIIHGTGPCPYPVMQWQLVSSSPGKGGGEEEVTRGEEEVTGEEEDDDVVMVTVVDKDDEPVEVITVPESTPPRSLYKQMARIRIGPRGRPTETLAPREGAREASPDSLEAGSAAWPLSPPSHLSGPATTTPPPPSSGNSSITPPPQDPTAASEQPPLQSPNRDRILRRFTHLMKPSCPSHRLGAWDLHHRP
jgi:hypothetical protein